MATKNKSSDTGKRSKAGKIISTVVLVPIVLLLALTVFLSIKSFANPGSIPDFFGWKYLVVLTGSMAGDQDDSFDAGAVVVIKETPTEDLKVGDIITYQTDQTIPTTHRIVEITPQGFVTRGDNNNADDLGVVAPGAVEGKVKFSIPKLGYVVQYLRTPFGIGALLVICVAVIFVPMLFKKKEPEKTND